jgi:hypothetical protein
MSDKYQAMRDACTAYIQPKGNMESREHSVIRSFKTRLEWENVCHPWAILELLDEIATLKATASQESAPEQEAVAVSTQEPDLIRKLRGLAAMVESQEGWRPTVVDEAIAALSAPPTSTAIAAVAIKQAATLVKVETRKGNSSGYYFDLRRDVGNFLYDAILKLSPEDAEAELEALITDRCTKVAEAVAKATENPDYSPSHLPFIVRRVLDEKGE